MAGSADEKMLDDDFAPTVPIPLSIALPPVSNLCDPGVSSSTAFLFESPVPSPTANTGKPSRRAARKAASYEEYNPIFDEDYENVESFVEEKDATIIFGGSDNSEDDAFEEPKKGARGGSKGKKGAASPAAPKKTASPAVPKKVASKVKNETATKAKAKLPKDSPKKVLAVKSKLGKKMISKPKSDDEDSFTEEYPNVDQEDESSEDIEDEENQDSDASGVKKPKKTAKKSIKPVVERKPVLKSTPAVRTTPVRRSVIPQMGNNGINIEGDNLLRRVGLSKSVLAKRSSRPLSPVRIPR